VSVRVELELNGARVPVTLADDALDEISAALEHNDADPVWPEWMSVETAARYLDVSPERLRKLQARREIPYSQEASGCRVFFRRADLDAWMTSQRTPARTTTP
jgi:excisionase family DNA binding protein